MALDNLSFLDGKVVLVRWSRDRHDPPTALRGTLHVATADDGVVVSVALDLPEMFTAPAHRRVVPLGQEAVSELLRSRVNDAYTCTLDYDFEQDTRDQTAVSPQARGGRTAASE